MTIKNTQSKHTPKVTSESCHRYECYDVLLEALKGLVFATSKVDNALTNQARINAKQAISKAEGREV